MPGQTLSARPRGYVQTPENAPGFWQLGNLWRIMASGYQTGNSLCLIDQLVTPDGGGPCTHMHPTDEGLYDFIFVPGGTPHARRATSDEARLLYLVTPSGFERVLETFGEQTTSQSPPPASWRGQHVTDDRRQQLFADLRLRMVTMLHRFSETA